jgi:hypothetical protein
MLLIQLAGDIRIGNGHNVSTTVVQVTASANHQPVLRVEYIMISAKPAFLRDSVFHQLTGN